MSYFSSPKKFFTLIEILIAIAIIGVILSISLISFSNVRQKSRDAERISDIQLLQKSLEDYYRNEGSYPATLTPGQSLVGASSSSTYMQLIPQNPSPRDDGACPDNDYVYTNENGSYTISFCLSETVGQLSAGRKCVAPTGIKNTACFVCGDPITISGVGNHVCNTGDPDYDTCTYDTVLIGTQCWMKQDANIGRRVTSTIAQTNNGTIEKYCLSNVASDCPEQGTFYQWNEAMQYSVLEEAQGVCPSGWHIPSDAEQNTLDQYLNDTTCNPNRSAYDCNNAGTKMLDNGSSGLDLITHSFRDLDGSFPLQYWYLINLWSSSISGGNGWIRHIEGPGVYRGPSDQNYGFNVRCLKN